MNTLKDMSQATANVYGPLPFVRSSDMGLRSWLFNVCEELLSWNFPREGC